MREAVAPGPCLPGAGCRLATLAGPLVAPVLRGGRLAGQLEPRRDGDSADAGESLREDGMGRVQAWGVPHAPGIEDGVPGRVPVVRQSLSVPTRDSSAEADRNRRVGARRREADQAARRGVPTAARSPRSGDQISCGHVRRC